MAQQAPESERGTLAALRRSAACDSDGNEKRTLSLHDRLFARVLAPPLAWLLLRCGLSADGVTLLSLLAGLAGAGCLAWGSAAGDLTAILLLQGSYLLDCVDGDVARARGTACLDGYLRDTFRHQLLPPALFVGLTFGVLSRHEHWWVLLAGLLGAAFGTRLVGGLDDQVTLEGLSRLPKRDRPGQAGSLQPGGGLPAAWSGPRLSEGQEAQGGVGPLGGLRRRVLPDFAQMNWLTLAVALDLLWLRGAQQPWLAIDLALPVLSGLQCVLKCGGLLLLWRRGVSGRVERLVRAWDRPPEP